MTHLHEVRDSDSHYIINPSTMEITNANGEKNTLQRGDHNSEILTFELPKEIEGHDMTLCNKIEVHYKNISAGDKTTLSADFYKVKDLKADEKEPGTLMFSWKVSGNATKYYGALEFRILFGCLDDNGIYVYKKWSKVFKGITVEDGFESTEHIEDVYSDGFAEGIALAVQNAIESGELNGVGKDGESVTVSSVSESTASGGSNVVIFSDGKTLTVKNGKDGASGKDGENYVLTDDDKTQIANIVATQLGGQPVYGIVGDDKTITLHGNVAFDEYTFGYIVNGEFVEIGKGEYVPDEPLEPEDNNLLHKAVNFDGTPFVGDNGEDGYKTGYRINSSDAEAKQDGCCYTGLMSVTENDTIYLEGVVLSDNGSYNRMSFYNANKELLYTCTFATSGFVWFSTTNNGYKFSPIAISSKTQGTAFFRLSTGSITDDSIISTQPIS